MLWTEQVSVTQCRRRCINEGPVSMGVALSHDLLRVSLCCSWLLCCKANFLFAIISKCHFYCIRADARRYGSRECAVYAYAIITREKFSCISNKQWKSLRITENHAQFCTQGSNAWPRFPWYQRLRFPVIFISYVYIMCIDAIFGAYAWYYSNNPEINSGISIYSSNTT